MALIIPTSLQELVGRRLTRIFISHDRDTIVFDTFPSSSNSRTRYAYSIAGNVDRFLNLSAMVGYTITGIEAAGAEANGQEKLVIYTDGGEEVGVIFFSYIIGDIMRITEDGAIRITEDAAIRLLDVSGSIYDVELTEVNLGKKPPYAKATAALPDQYIVEEGDVDYGITFEGDTSP